MDKSLIRTSTIGMADDDWLSFRDRGLGASDISTVLHLNPYKSSLELFHEKIGNKQSNFFGNFRTFVGHEMEDKIAEWWTYWSGSMESIQENKKAGNIIRRMQKINAYVQNPDYPHLFVSLDRKINKHDGKGEGALELKTIGGYESKKWLLTNVPLGYIIQVLTQMLVCMFEYGELAYVRDLQMFDVLPIEKRNSLINMIIEMTTDFWERVMKGRILMNQRYEAELSFNMKLHQEIDAEIALLEPAVDSSDRLADFLNDTFDEVKKGMIQGDISLFTEALKHKRIKERIKKLNTEATHIENKFKQYIRERSGIDFSEKGCIYWSDTKAGIRVFRNRIIV